MKPMKADSKRAKQLNRMINGMPFLAKMMLNQLSFSVETSIKYKNSEEQVDAFLKKFPSMKDYREVIISRAKQFREENGIGEEYSDDDAAG